MNIKDVQDAMEDLIVSHGCTEETVIFTDTGKPIDGFDFGEDGKVYVINSLGEIADSDMVERLRNMRAQRNYYKGTLERYQEEIFDLKEEIEETKKILTSNCKEYDKLEAEMYDAYNEILRGKNDRAISIIEEYGRGRYDESID